MPAPESPPRPMNRREAIRRVGALLGGAAFVGRGLAEAALQANPASLPATIGEFSAADVVFLDEIAETILPETRTPGAKAAHTGAFMALMVTDCYRPAERKIFRDGMRRLDEAARRAHGVRFMQATPAQRTAVLTALDHEQQRVMEARDPADDHSPAHYFRMMKELALLGYFTSEIGCTQAQRYVETPGRFDACLPYSPGEPAWAAHA